MDPGKPPLCSDFRDGGALISLHTPLAVGGSDGQLCLYPCIEEEWHADTGMTADLSRRIWEDREGLPKGFTSRYGVVRLVWYREFFDIGDAIVFEKRIKKWRSVWKTKLIKEINLDWQELYRGMGW